MSNDTWLIDRFTTGQSRHLDHYITRWREIAFSSGPLDRKKVENDIDLVYKCAGLSPPAMCVWHDSPNFLAAVLKKDEWRKETGTLVGERVSRKIFESQFPIVRTKIAPHVRQILNHKIQPFRNEMRIFYDHIQRNGILSPEAVYFMQASIAPTLVVMAAQADYIRNVLGLKSETETLVGLISIHSHGGIFVVPYEKICYVSERASVLKIDERSLLHSHEGPALCYTDKEKLYVSHGVVVPEFVIERPETIEINDIESQTNVELRRVMIERYGLSRYIQESGAKLISEDRYGQLYRKTMPDDRPIVMVKVINSTPEPDGTNRVYFLRVPDWCHTAHQGVAWGFGLTPDEYNPIKET